MTGINNFDIMITDFINNEKFRDSVAHHFKTDEKAAEFRDFPDDIHPLLKKAYNKKGINRLYSHQYQSYKTIKKNEDTVIVTPTASGKTLCYNLPVLDTILKNPSDRSVYLFPTKALSQDQQSEILTLSKDLDYIVNVYTYDGDTPRDVRENARKKGQVIITNPDMLHVGIMPNHTRWVNFFENLKFIVIDEVHTYRGVFGSQVAGVIQRLLRLCKFYGSNPIIITCSATIENPKELSEKLTSRKFTKVDGDGAPKGSKNYIFYNPRMIDQLQGIRSGVVKEAVRVASYFISKHIKTIIFARSRINVELISNYLRQKFPLRHDIAAYRGGYLPNERHKIEKNLRDGKITAIVSTNALELGIDIGGLDVAITAGFPGSNASFFQQTGRAGRSNKDSCAILISSSSPLDQFFIEHPEFILEQKGESVVIDPENVYIHLDQLKCAAFEIPFKKNEKFMGNIDDYLELLVENRVLHEDNDRFYWSQRSFPAENVNLRSGQSGNFTIIDMDGNIVIGEMDRFSAAELIYEQAIYIHQGQQYQVKKMDYEGQKVYIEKSNVNYYTDAVSRYELEVLRKINKKQIKVSSIELHNLEILIRRLTPKFKKIKFHSHENIGFGEINLPEEEMHTTSLALVFPPPAFNEYDEAQKEEILQSITNLIVKLIPIVIFCDKGDIGAFPQIKNPFFLYPTLFLYDKYAGGIGLSQKIFETFNEIIHFAKDRIKKCKCKKGCPSCIGINSSISKEIVLNYIAKYLDENESLME